MQQLSQPWEITIRKEVFIFLFFLFSIEISSSIEDYIYSDIGPTSNINGELGIINIPSSRILDEGNLKLHLVNSYPINSLLITATPFDWMEVSLRYSDINTELYSPYKSFSGDQTNKDKSFNLKLKLIEESQSFPELSIGMRDFIGTGRFSGEYIVTSKKIGDFDLSLGLGWGSLAHPDGITNPMIDLDDAFSNREAYFGKGGNFDFASWFSGKKVSPFYGFEYVNKYSGLRFKFDFDKSDPFGLNKRSNYSYGISIPASKYVDVNIFRHRGKDLGISLSYKANYSENIVKKNIFNPRINFNEKDMDILSSEDDIFSGTINVLLRSIGINVQEIYFDEKNLEIIVNNPKYRNQNKSNSRIVRILEEVLLSRKIENLTLTYQNGNINTNSHQLNVLRYISYLDNNFSYRELRKFSSNSNYTDSFDRERIFKGKINFPIYSWGINPNLKNHIGAPEAFYSGQIGIFVNGGIDFRKSSFLNGSLSLNLYNNIDQLKLKAFSRLPKVRSDIREYLKEGRYSLARLSFTHLFNPIYSDKGLIISGMKIGLFEEMFGGIGAEILYRDVAKPWYVTANAYWVKQRAFNQRFSFRNYETYTGHLNFIWDTPLSGVKMIISGGKYLAKDSGLTLNLSKSFKSGFTLGFFATKTDISALEFGEGSFDKGIFFSLPLDIVSKSYSKNNANFVWRNLTRDGGAMLSGGLNLQGLTEDSSSKFLNYIQQN